MRKRCSGSKTADQDPARRAGVRVDVGAAAHHRVDQYQVYAVRDGESFDERKHRSRHGNPLPAKLSLDARRAIRLGKYLHMDQLAFDAKPSRRWKEPDTVPVVNRWLEG